MSQNPQRRTMLIVFLMQVALTIGGYLVWKQAQRSVEASVASTVVTQHEDCQQAGPGPQQQRNHAEGGHAQ